MKICANCKVEKLFTEFFRDKGTRSGYCSWCKVCKTSRKNSEAGRLTSRKWHLQSKYSMTVEDYDSLLDYQHGKCAICGDNDPIILRGGPSFVVDHDHSCCPGEKSCGKCIRGLICHSCNLGLGNFKDNLETMRSAILYLEQNLREEGTNKWQLELEHLR